MQLLPHNTPYTEARNRVFIALKQCQPCTVQELIRGLDGRVDRRTIQRSIKLFEELGLIFRPENKLIYLASHLIQHSHVLTCTKCGRTIPYRDARLEQALDRLTRSKRFAMTGHALAIFGTCGQHVDRP